MHFWKTSLFLAIPLHCNSICSSWLTEDVNTSINIQLWKPGQLISGSLFFIAFRRTLNLSTTGHYFYSKLKKQVIFAVVPRNEVPCGNISPPPQVWEEKQFQNSNSSNLILEKNKPSMHIHQNNINRHVSGTHYLYLILTEQGSWSWSPQKLTKPVFIVFLK